MGILKGIFGRRRLKSERPKASNLAMIALRSSEAVDLNAIVERLRSADGVPRSNGVPDVGNGSAVVQIDGFTIGLTHIGFPIPWSDLEWPVKTAWTWPDAEAVVKEHRSHVLVFASSEQAEIVQISLVLVRAVCAAIEETEAVAVYYGNASIVVPADRYLAQAAGCSATDLPLFLWLGFHPVQGAGLSIYTTGMPVFGLLDLEVNESALDLERLVDFVANLAHYEIAGAVQIEDGESVGASEIERITVRHRPSRFGANAITCQIQL